MRLTVFPDDERGPEVAEADPLPSEHDARAARPAVLEGLYHSYHHWLLRVMRRRVRDERAQDVVQQVFCRMANLTDAEQQGIVAPGAYLLRVAHNLLRDEARLAKRRSADLHLCDEDVALRASDQQAMLEARDSLRRLEAALGRLKPRTREIFLAHRMDGYSYGEIARLTGLRIKTVEMHMTRAIAYLARHRDL